MTQKQFSGQTNPDSSIERQFRLLLVDENSQELQFYTAMLRHLGYNVWSAGSNTGAVELLGQEAFDLIIVDQGGRDFEGRSVLRQAVEVDHCTPVLVLAGLVDADCCLNALDLGANEYVQKPLTRCEFQELIEDYLKPSAKFAAPNCELKVHAERADIEPRGKDS